MPACLLMWLLLFLPSGSVASCNQNSGAGSVSHQLWTDLLQAHVSEDGNVNYQALKKEPARLNRYLRLLSQAQPENSTWTREQQMAFWINAYNAFTLKLIIDNYPLKSIRDLNGLPATSNPNAVWDRRFIKIGSKDYSLNEIEHNILRKRFSDPRIHFALNCASRSCPPLRREAYEAARLEDQLQKQARNFINNPKYNTLSPEKARISEIFIWYSGDFTAKGSLIDFLNSYAVIKIKPEAKITYLGYDWSLNDKPLKIRLN